MTNWTNNSTACKGYYPPRELFCLQKRHWVIEYAIKWIGIGSPAKYGLYMRVPICLKCFRRIKEKGLITKSFHGFEMIYENDLSEKKIKLIHARWLHGQLGRELKLTHKEG